MLWIYGMPTRFDGDSAARTVAAQKVGHRHCRLGVAPCTIYGMSTSITAGNPCFLRQKLLWRHFSRSLSMWLFSFLCWAHERKNQFLSKSNQTSTLFPPTCEKWLHSKNWFLRKKFVNDFTLVAVALYARQIIDCPCPLIEAMWVLPGFASSSCLLLWGGSCRTCELCPGV